MNSLREILFIGVSATIINLLVFFNCQQKELPKRNVAVSYSKSKKVAKCCQSKIPPRFGILRVSPNQ